MPGLFLATADDLLTAPWESDPFAVALETPTSLWVEEDVDTSKIIVGGSGGSLSLSETGGTVWTEIHGPEPGTPVIRLARSRDFLNQLHVLLPTGYWTSPDNGGSWALVLAAADGEVFYDLCLSHARNIIGSSMGVRSVTGSLFTGLDDACPNIIAVAPDVNVDSFFCYDAGGQCYYQAAPGTTVFTAGATLPDPTQAMVRGLWRGGLLSGLLYVANGTNGLWKSLNGFLSTDGFIQLRKPSVDGAGTGPWYQVGSAPIVVPAII